jgi:hypothetical protein
MQIGSGPRFCSDKCRTDWVIERGEKERAKNIARAQKAERKNHRARKEAIKPRTGEKGWYKDLKTVLHRYVKHVLRTGEPCYTCGKQQSPGDEGGAFHVGHFIPAGTVDPRRFMLENLRIQCYSCNAMNSGRRVEYRAALIEEMGLEHVEWLEADCNHLELKQQYPTIEDIKAEISRYRQLIRDAGLTPRR